MKHLVCFHLYNDYSGSPKVLKDILSGLLNEGYRIDLVTSKGGVLDEIPQNDRFRIRYYNYHFSMTAGVTIIRYSFIQLLTFFIALRYIFCRNSTFYINTILPVGPALAGWLTGKHVIYHYHENATAKGFVYSVLSLIMQHIASDIICVSKYQSSFLKRGKNIHVVPNALSEEFNKVVNINIEKSFFYKRILMLSSLKLYKGTLDFFKLACMLPNLNFSLVINDTQENIDSFLKDNDITPSPNMKIYSRQKKVMPFYAQSSILVNLSNKKLAIETFGLTALEAMACGLPVIVPTEGGIAENVTAGYNGYKIDVQDLDKIASCIDKIMNDFTLYATLATNAKRFSEQFKTGNTIKAIINIIEKGK